MSDESRRDDLRIISKEDTPVIVDHVMNGRTQLTLSSHSEIVMSIVAALFPAVLVWRLPPAGFALQPVDEIRHLEERQ